jgi:uncharacterized protein YpuA (DUF1002 family)
MQDRELIRKQVIQELIEKDLIYQVTEKEFNELVDNISNRRKLDQHWSVLNDKTKSSKERLKHLGLALWYVIKMIGLPEFLKTVNYSKLFGKK